MFLPGSWLECQAAAVGRHAGAGSATRLPEPGATARPPSGAAQAAGGGAGGRAVIHTTGGLASEALMPPRHDETEPEGIEPEHQQAERTVGNDAVGSA